MKKLMNSNKAKFIATFLTSSVLAFAQSSPLENVVNAGEAMTIRS
jgi:hypothetical protein